MSEIHYYDWVVFFKELCASIDSIYEFPNRDELLFEKARLIFEPANRILQYPHTDPFSFLYALAQRNTVNQRQEVYGRAIQVFGLTVHVPTDIIFPTPVPSAAVLFHENGLYVDRDGSVRDSCAIWKLFHAAYHGEILYDEDYKSVINLKYVRFVKLSQVLFLVNPKAYIPFDGVMNSLPIPELDDLKSTVSLIDAGGLPAYYQSIEFLRKAFPRCELFEINLLNVMLNSTDVHKLKLSFKFCQISSWAEGQGDRDFFKDFTEESAIWTGGPTGATGVQHYPLEDFDRGDIVLVRRGTKKLGGIAVVLANGYKTKGFDPDKSIRVVWLTKEEKWIQGTALGQRIGFYYATNNTLDRFRECYPETFQLIQQLRNQQKAMIDHAANTRKNIIFTGPPGTGKTRIAKQVAEWLTTGSDFSMTLMEAIDKKIFKNDPNIEGIDEVKLIQFHPSYAYEDFVRGITAEAQGEKLGYKVENKWLAKIAEEAAKPENQKKAYVLIIDEINRANLSTVLGELIYALEYRGQAVQSLYAYENETELIIPNNLYILGTMNTADRSVGHVDYAIRRRFSFVTILPDPEAITNPQARALYIKVDALFNTYTSGDFEPNDVRIGHSYFLGDASDLKFKLTYEIKPILMEYLRDGVLKQSARQSITDLNV